MTSKQLMAFSIPHIRLPVSHSVCWKMMESGMCVCRKPVKCRQVVSCVCSLQLSSSTVSLQSLLFYGTITRSRYVIDDLHARLINHHHIPEPTADQVFDYGLYLINRLLLQSAKDLTHFPPMPLPEGDWNQHNGNDNYLLQEQLELDPYDLLLRVQHDRDLFNNEQQAAYDAVMHSINHKKGKAFFLHSAGGGGKTFVCNTVASIVHSNEHVALAVTSSAVAAQILELGHTF